MNLLKKENWWVWLILTLYSQGVSTIVLGAMTGVFTKKAWYANWKNWVIGLVCLIFPALIMAYIFLIQITCQTAAKLDVPGKEVYLSPYIWILCIIIPIFGWMLMFIMLIYLEIYTIVMLYRGAGEKYILKN